MKRPRIGFDVDGVLFDLLTPCLAVASEMLERTLTIEDVKEHDLDVLFESKADLLESFWQKIGQPGLCRNLVPYPGAVEGIDAIREIGDIFCVTSYLHDAPQWVHERDQALEEHFGIARSQMVHTKSKFVFHGDMLVDDKPRNIEEWAAEHLSRGGVPVLWSQPYNAAHVLPESIRARTVRTCNWWDLRYVCVTVAKTIP